MSDAIARIANRTPAVPAVKDARTEKLEKAAGEFESLFVKQLLKEAKIGGDQKSGGYADMAVDALASGIQRGGGLGLAKRIEQALALHAGASAKAASPSPHLHPAQAAPAAGAQVPDTQVLPVQGPQTATRPPQR